MFSWNRTFNDIKLNLSLLLGSDFLFPSFHFIESHKLETDSTSKTPRERKTILFYQRTQN